MCFPMPLTHVSRSLLILCTLAFAAAPARTATPEERPFLAPVFTDHMVLQRGKPNTFWGWTTPGARVSVAIAERHAAAHADSTGRWQVNLEPPAVGGPYVVRIDGPASRDLTDVLVGDVWLCSGQSNMQWPLSRALGGEEAAEAADRPQLRLFRVPQTVAYARGTAVSAAWRVCTPQEAAEFSAVAYFFGERLQDELSVPIGLVQSAVGGSPIESWMSPEALSAFPEVAPALEEIARLQAAGVPPTGSFLMHWLDQYDAGLAGDTWAAPMLDEAGWKNVTVPGGFADFGVADAPAIVWFRREVELPDPLPTGTARLQLGVVEKMDTAYINGRWVGASSWVENPRTYAIPAGALRPGLNQIAIRVFKLRPDGGFQSPPERLRLVLGDGTALPLAGEWKAQLSLDARPPHPLPLSYENYPTMPTVLQHGMLAPLAPLALSGALWYQGEANFTRAAQYRKLLPAMIADWRALFRQPDLPVFVVSLPAFMARREKPDTDGWADLRGAQAFAAATVPNTAVAVTIDLGDPHDIHPRDKRPVSDRLALLALDDHYGRDVVSRGPRYASFERRGNECVVYFTHTDGGLEIRGGPPEFALAGPDGTWHWADGRIEGDTVVVSSSEVSEPVAIRYAWQANPRATLFNRAGLPAAPFSTALER